LGGEVGVRTFDPASEALLDVERVRLRLKDGQDCEFTVDSVRGGAKELIVAFEEVENRAAAEKLVGSTVFVYRDELEPPGEGEYFQGDLIGLDAVDEQGGALGVVEEIWNTGPVPNIVIRAEGKPELVVPFTDDFVPRVEIAEKRIVVRPPEFSE
jgi:16S rRNA processing protein RimM